MANEALNARMRLDRFGDRNSRTNRKLRFAPLQLISGICKHFPFDGKSAVELPRCYRISFGGEGRERYRCFSFFRDSENIMWTFGEKSDDPQGWVTISFVELDDVHRLARDVASGWLGEVCAFVKRLYGEDAAYRFKQEFRL